MAFEYIKVFTPRAISLDYVSPAVCEGDYSGSGEVMISLLPILPDYGPLGLLYEYMGFFRLRWTIYPGVLCYSVYKLVDEVDPYSKYIIVAECVDGDHIDLPDPGTYDVEEITPNGVGRRQRIVLPPPPPPVDPCEPEAWEELGPVPASFGVEEQIYEFDVPAPNPHLDFDVPYVPNVVNVFTWPEGDGWDLDIDWVSGNWAAADGAGPIYSGWGLRVFRNGTAYGIRSAVCSDIGRDQTAIQAALDANSFFFQETTLNAGEQYGLAIDLTNVSWANGQLGSSNPTTGDPPVDNPYYDVTQTCPGTRFDAATSATISCNLRLRARVWRDTTPPFTRARIIGVPDFKAGLTNPPEFVAGPWGPETFRFAAEGGAEWDGHFNCTTSWDAGWYLEPCDCDGYPNILDLCLNGYERDLDIQVSWADQYVDKDDVLHHTPAWTMEIHIDDVNWGAAFMWWTGVKLTGTTPAGTYLVWPRYAYNLIVGGQKWTNPYQTELFAKDLACVKIEPIA